ncbi:hypothetical protein QOZ95_004746 [Paenibacillus brasilensis]|uniref:Uncharacterized protein n=1 Tax=Paenibacillus brasilensis TaxID=128574 RepID=A0ABU0L5M5_9BACL|nr:hypothetical protein [Paenibacillus brasilensis]
MTVLRNTILKSMVFGNIIIYTVSHKNIGKHKSYLLTGTFA